ncbi:MAG TPA: hypothetical protein VMH77_02275 [Steroidobacteraceae bacterium]|nr:hypothetical protein [Steroidobacteraceae bacterium]
MKTAAKATLGTLWMLGVGLAPVWVATGMVITGGAKAHQSSDYWAVAPWTIVIGIVFSGVSLVVAGVTLATFLLARGGAGRKFALASLVFAVCVVLVAGDGAQRWHRKQVQDADQRSLEQAGAEYVRQHPLVIRRLGPAVSVFLSERSASDAVGVPLDYTYAVRPQADLKHYQEAVVAVTRTPSGPRFHLRCVVTDEAFRNRDAFSDACHPKFDPRHAPSTPDAVELAE